MYRPILALALMALPHAAFAQATLSPPDGFERLQLTGNDETLVCMRGGEGPVVLFLHGWPQTAAEWKPILPRVAESYTAIACDLPGIRNSTNADGDFSKADMAADIHAAISEGGIGPVHLVGHDIGLMVAYAYASDFPDSVSSVTFMDAPLPGTPTYDQITADPRAWHFAFHSAPNPVPETIVANDLEFYIGHFIESLWVSEDHSPEETIAASVAAYSDPETLQTGFEFYRAFAQDAEDNASRLETPLQMPVLALNAGGIAEAPYVLQMFEPLAEDVRGEAIPGIGHWMSEEAPDAVANRILTFLGNVAQ